MAVPVQYSARLDLPDLIERGRTTTLRCRVYRAGSLATPSSGTVSIYSADETAIVDAQAVTTTSGSATYDVAGATTSSLDLEDGWRVVWTLAMPDGRTYDYRNEAALVRHAPAPVVTEQVIYARVPSLNPVGQAPISARQDYSTTIDEAWTEISTRLLRAGRRPWLVISPSRLREPHLLLTLALVYEDLAGRVNPAHAEMARSYREQYEQSWARLELVYDYDDDGDADDQPATARGSLWLMGRGR